MLASESSQSQMSSIQKGLLPHMASTERLLVLFVGQHSQQPPIPASGLYWATHHLSSLSLPL